MDLNEITITNLVIKWLEKEAYSKNHWQTVAEEIKEKNQHNTDQAIDQLASAIEGFHNLYKNKVVQENNLLQDLLTLNFDKVQWRLVAKRFIKKTGTISPPDRR